MKWALRPLPLTVGSAQSRFPQRYMRVEVAGGDVRGERGHLSKAFGGTWSAAKNMDF